MLISTKISRNSAFFRARKACLSAPCLSHEKLKSNYFNILLMLMPPTDTRDSAIALPVHSYSQARKPYTGTNNYRNLS